MILFVSLLFMVIKIEDARFATSKEGNSWTLYRTNRYHWYPTPKKEAFFFFKFDAPLFPPSLQHRERHRLCYLIKVSQNLATSPLSTSLFVIHNSSRGGENKVSKLTRRKQVVYPILKILELDVKAG